MKYFSFLAYIVLVCSDVITQFFEKFGINSILEIHLIHGV